LVRGYYVDITGKNTKKIVDYIQNQLKEAQLSYQIAGRKYQGPFTGVYYLQVAGCYMRFKAPLAT